MVNLDMFLKPKFEPKGNFTRPTWIIKSKLKANQSFNLFKLILIIYSTDNDYSRHMTGDCYVLINYKNVAESM